MATRCPRIAQEPQPSPSDLRNTLPGQPGAGVLPCGRTRPRNLALTRPPGIPAVPTKVKITAMRNVTHDKTTNAMRAVECVTKKLAARNSRPHAIISG
jgi:hypothetical protein